MDKKYESTIATWKKLADIYHEKFMDLNIYDDTYAYFCNSLGTEQNRVLELAAGPGNISYKLLQYRQDLDLLLTDVSEKMLQKAKECLPGIKTQQLDLRHLNHLKGKYDGIICGFGIPYLSPQDLNIFLDDMKDRLLECGILYLSFVDGKQSESAYQTGSNGDRVFFNYHDKKHIINKLIELNFTIKKEFAIEYASAKGIEAHTIIIANLNLSQSI